MTDHARTPCIYVLAGTNGAGKSTVGGAMFRELRPVEGTPDYLERLT